MTKSTKKYDEKSLEFARNLIPTTVINHKIRLKYCLSFEEIIVLDLINKTQDKVLTNDDGEKILYSRISNSQIASFMAREQHWIMEVLKELIKMGLLEIISNRTYNYKRTTDLYCRLFKKENPIYIPPARKKKGYTYKASSVKPQTDSEVEIYNKYFKK